MGAITKERITLFYQKGKRMPDVLYYFKGKSIDVPSLRASISPKGTALSNIRSLALPFKSFTIIFPLKSPYGFECMIVLYYKPNILSLKSHRICLGFSAGNKDHIS